jgi:hypothetical protein
MKIVKPHTKETDEIVCPVMCVSQYTKKQTIPDTVGLIEYSLHGTYGPCVRRQLLVHLGTKSQKWKMQMK